MSCMASRSNARFMGGLLRVWPARRASTQSPAWGMFISDAPKAKLLRPVVRALVRLALGSEHARLILQNRDDVSLFEQKGIMPRAHIRLIPGSGVDCARGDKPVAGQPLRVVLAARMLWDKGVGEFVNAARLLKAGKRKLQFLLAGSPDPGNPASIPEKTLLEWQKSRLVEWLGHVEDMPAVLAAADIVALPS